MFKRFVVLCCLPVLASAQQVELIVRDRQDVSQNDIAARVVIPHAMLEIGTVRTTSRDQWAYFTTDTHIGKAFVGGEAFIAPASKYVSRHSLGGTVGYVPSDQWSVAQRVVYYYNPDASKQWLYATTAEYTKPYAVLSGSVGGLTGSGVVGQVKATLLAGNSNKMILYWSNDMELPNMPWSVWVVREAGVMVELKLAPSYTVVVGRAFYGKVGTTEYTSFTIGNKIQF